MPGMKVLVQQITCLNWEFSEECLSGWVVRQCLSTREYAARGLTIAQNHFKSGYWRCTNTTDAHLHFKLPWLFKNKCVQNGMVYQRSSFIWGFSQVLKWTVYFKMIQLNRSSSSISNCSDKKSEEVCVENQTPQIATGQTFRNSITWKLVFKSRLLGLCGGAYLSPNEPPCHWALFCCTCFI